MKKFQLYYNCRNGGDGSVSVDLHSTEQAANKAEESMDEGWGESSVGSITIIQADDGNLWFEDYDTIDGKFQKVSIKLEECD